MMGGVIQIGITSFILYLYVKYQYNKINNNEFTKKFINHVYQEDNI